jgi:hypothetical protein
LETEHITQTNYRRSLLAIAELIKLIHEMTDLLTSKGGEGIL